MKLKRNKTLYLILAVTLSLVLIISGCSSNNNNNSSNNNNSPDGSNDIEVPNGNDEVEPEEVTIRVVVPSPVTGTTEFEELFNEYYPHIKVELHGGDGSNTSEHMLELITALNAAGTPADMVWTPNPVPFIADDLLVDLTPYYETHEILSQVDIPQGVIDYATWDGKIMGIPRASDPFIVFVNKDMLAKNGLEMPGPDWTFDDYRSIARLVTDAEAGEWGISEHPYSWHMLAWAKAVADGVADNLAFMNEDLTQSVLPTPEGMEIIQWMADLQNVDGSLGTHEQRQAAGVGADGWHQGRIAFDTMGVWEGTRRKEAAQFDWGVLPLPAGKVKQVGAATVPTVGILKGSENIEAAVTYAAFRLHPEGERYAMAQGAFPITNDPELWEELASTDTWEGTGVVDAVRNLLIEPNIIGEEHYVQWWSNGQDGFKHGGDLNEIFRDPAETWNRLIGDLRSEMGL